MKALIFDMDGVILDSEVHWKKSELSFFGELLPSWTTEDQQKIIGMNVDDTYRILANKYGLTITHKEFRRRVNGIALEVYKNQANLLPGFLELITKLKNLNIPIGLASSSLNEWIDIALEKFKLRSFFDVVVSAEDIDGPGKPAPDIYLHAAKLLNTQPKDCLVIEDSKHGITSAKSANTFCVGIRNGFNQAQDQSEADLIIEGFTEESNQKIMEFFI